MRAVLLRLRLLLRVVLLFAVIFAIIFASCMLQSAPSDLNCKLQITVCSAGPQQGVPDGSVQRRTSPGELQSGVCSAGPHPGSSRTECAAPDPTGQEENARKYVRKECQKICQKRMSEDMSEKDVRRYVSKGCQKRMSEKDVRKGC